MHVLAMATQQSQVETLLTWIPGGSQNPADIHTRSKKRFLNIEGPFEQAKDQKGRNQIEDADAIARKLASVESNVKAADTDEHRQEKRCTDTNASFPVTDMSDLEQDPLPLSYLAIMPGTHRYFPYEEYRRAQMSKLESAVVTETH